MVFHAIIKYRRKNHAYRYFITAPDADTVDEWWREVSDTKEKEGWVRLAPDWYSYDYASPETFFTDRIIWNLASDFGGRDMRVISHQKRTDHVSGESFYIRSKSNPEIHWVVFGSQIIAGYPGRTRFRIKIDNEDKPKVMIGKDPITITLATDPQVKVVINNDNTLTVGQQSSRMFFGYFKNGFLAEGPGNEQGVPNWNSLRKAEDIGEEWELVR